MNNITNEALAMKLKSLDVGTTTNLGVPGAGVVANERGNPHYHTTHMAVEFPNAFLLDDAASLGDNRIIYTLPAGDIIVHNAKMELLVTNAEHNTEAFEIGLGTAEANGVISVLSGTAAFENILTGQTAAIGTTERAMDISNSTGGTGGLLIPAASSHEVHVNIAGAWADTAGVDMFADLSGLVILNWSFMG